MAALCSLAELKNDFWLGFNWSRFFELGNSNIQLGAFLSLLRCMRVLVQFLWVLLISNFASVPQGITVGNVVSITNQTEHKQNLVPLLSNASTNTSVFTEFEELELEEEETHTSSSVLLSLNNFLHYLPFFYELPLKELNGEFVAAFSSKIPLFLKYSALLI
jgi:hypothetical protein